MYRRWMHEKGVAMASGGEWDAFVVELRREVHTALGTAKWQVSSRSLFLSVIIVFLRAMGGFFICREKIRSWRSWKRRSDTAIRLLQLAKTL